jgi:hypothetical protein
VRAADALRVSHLPPCSAPRARALTLLALALIARSAPGRQEERPRAPLALPRDLARAEDGTGSGLAFVELDAARDTYLLGEPFVLVLRFGLERELLRSELVQLFQRTLDVPAQVFAPALERREGALFLDESEPETGASFALGETITRAERASDVERGGRTYAVFEYSRRIAATRPGELALEPPVLGFARATTFGEDFDLGRVPLDRRDVLVRGTAADIHVLPLPEEGRPAEFTGAIGRYSIHAVAEPRELAAGGSLALTLRIEAAGRAGDLSQCPAPDLEGLPGFHVRGSLVEHEPIRLTARYDLVPLDESVTAVPPIRFAFFDVTPPAGYRTIQTEPIALRVRAAAAPPADALPPDPSAPPSWPSLLAVGGVAVALTLVLALALRKRRADA